MRFMVGTRLVGLLEHLEVLRLELYVGDLKVPVKDFFVWIP